MTFSTGRENTIVNILLLILNVVDHDISNTVLHMMDLASKIQELEFKEDQIDGGVEGVCLSRDEDMLVAMCHIAECHTFNKPIDLDIFSA